MIWCKANCRNRLDQACAVEDDLHIDENGKCLDYIKVRKTYVAREF